MTTPAAEPALADDLPAVLALLANAALPTAGVAQSFPVGYSVVRDGGRVVAVAGLEVHGANGLLRSVAVDPACRRAGLGGRLVDALLIGARRRSLASVYLLTTTAAEYFRRLGFEDVQRSAAPEELQRSSEFASVCPASAVCLRMALR